MTLTPEHATGNKNVAQQFKNRFNALQDFHDPFKRTEIPPKVFRSGSLRSFCCSSVRDQAAAYLKALKVCCGTLGTNMWRTSCDRTAVNDCSLYTCRNANGWELTREEIEIKKH